MDGELRVFSIALYNLSPFFLSLVKAAVRTYLKRYVTCPLLSNVAANTAPSASKGCLTKLSSDCLLLGAFAFLTGGDKDPAQNMAGPTLKKVPLKSEGIVP